MENDQDRKAIKFNTIPEALSALEAGKAIVVLDDQNREAEGDLVVAAEKITPEAINFMITHGRGLLCVAMDGNRLRQLGISRMPAPGGGDPFKTAFMESVDARDGITTGISAYDRAHTVGLLVDEDAHPSDLIRPGHIFPLEAVEGGVLTRPGHTEAAVDLARMAGLRPAGVICEILREDGTMARAADLAVFARKHDLCMVSVEDLIRYRQKVERLVRKEQVVAMPTAFGNFQLHLYYAPMHRQHHIALVMGDVTGEDPVLVRLHSECLTGDVFGSLRCDCGDQMREAMRLVAKTGSGVILYMRQEGRGIGLAKKIQAYALQEHGLDTVEANHQLGFAADIRDYGLGAQILRELNVRKIRLITNNPNKISGLQDYGVDVVERVPLILPQNEFNKNYLDTKKVKLGHLF